MSWFDEIKSPKIKPKQKTAEQPKSKIPEGMWQKCKKCSGILQVRQLEDNMSVCSFCGFHFRMKAHERIALLSDPSATFREFHSNLKSSDPLGFFDVKDYKSRLESAYRKTGIHDAIITGETALAGVRYALGVFEFSFTGGSMGGVVGEKVARLFEYSIENKIPAVVVTSTGGARMQEGIISLMQMAKTSALVNEMKNRHIPYIAVLADPTTGGVTASFAMQADVILSEPGALIGFAGPRVIEQAMKKALPEGFQRAEFLLEHGFLDKVVNRKDLPDVLGRLLKMSMERR